MSPLNWLYFLNNCPNYDEKLPNNINEKINIVANGVLKK